MTEQTQHDPDRGTDKRPPTTDQILDLLLDALAERQRTRQGVSTPPAPAGDRAPGPSPLGEKEAAPAPQPAPLKTTDLPPTRPEPPPPVASHKPPAVSHKPLVPKPALEPGEEGWQPPARLPSINMGKLLGRLAILVVGLVVLINIPVKSHGVSLSRMLPDSASLAIRDGLVLKASGPEIYMLRADKLHWISSMEKFEELGLTWEDVHVVDDKFLEQFEMGYPLGTILKCQASPHIYALVDGKKRWIKDIATFTGEGYTWQDVEFVTCSYLAGLPDGPPIPEDAGTPPQP